MRWSHTGDRRNFVCFCDEYLKKETVFHLLLTYFAMKYQRLDEIYTLGLV